MQDSQGQGAHRPQRIEELLSGDSLLCAVALGKQLQHLDLAATQVGIQG